LSGYDPVGLGGWSLRRRPLQKRRSPTPDCALGWRFKRL